MASTARVSQLASWVVDNPRPDPEPAAKAVRKPG
jgi:hypothetical protein